MADNNKFIIRVPRTDLTKPMEAGIEAIRGAQELIRKFGAQVEPALYALLCDTESSSRAVVDKALKNGGTAASAALIPLLISNHGISPAIATMVAAVVVQAIATVGQQKLCQALSTAAVHKPAPAAAAPRPEPSPAEAETRPTKPRKPRAANKPKPKSKPAKPGKPRASTKKSK